jgi:hypothetical protein
MSVSDVFLDAESNIFQTFSITLVAPDYVKVQAYIFESLGACWR